MRGQGKNPKYHPLIREYWRNAKQQSKQVEQLIKKCTEKKTYE